MLAVSGREAKLGVPPPNSPSGDTETVLGFLGEGGGRPSLSSLPGKMRV